MQFVSATWGSVRGLARNTPYFVGGGKSTGYDEKSRTPQDAKTAFPHQKPTLRAGCNIYPKNQTPSSILLVLQAV